MCNFLFDHFFAVVGVTCRNRVLPNQVFCRHFRADVACFRTQVTVRQLEPRLRESFLEVLRIRDEFFADSAIGRIYLHRHIRIGHDRVVANRGVAGVNRLVFLFDVNRFPLVGTGRTLSQFPLVAEQQVEIAHIEFRGVGGPRTFDTRGHGVARLALHVGVAPT